MLIAHPCDSGRAYIPSNRQRPPPFPETSGRLATLCGQNHILEVQVYCPPGVGCSRMRHMNLILNELYFYFLFVPRSCVRRCINGNVVITSFGCYTSTLVAAAAGCRTTRAESRILCIARRRSLAPLTGIPDSAQRDPCFRYPCRRSHGTVGKQGSRVNRRLSGYRSG